MTLRLRNTLIAAAATVLTSVMVTIPYSFIWAGEINGITKSHSAALENIALTQTQITRFMRNQSEAHGKLDQVVRFIEGCSATHQQMISDTQVAISDLSGRIDRVLELRASDGRH